MEEEEEASALSLPTTQEEETVRNAKDHTLLYYRRILKDNSNAPNQGERNQGSNEVVVCAICSGIYSRTGIWKHKQQCNPEATTKVPSIPLTILHNDG